MANTLGISTADDLAEMAADIPATLVFGVDTVTGVMSTVERIRNIDPETDLEEYIARFQCAKADLTTYTSIKTGQTTVAVNSVNYWVDGLNEDEYGEVLLMDLRRVQSGL